MPDFQNFDFKPNPTASKLLEVDSDLAAHEADLLAQLQSLKEKRKSLKTVIDMFAAADTAGFVEAPTRATDINDESEQSALESATQSLDDSQLSPTPTADDNKEFSAREQKTPEVDSFGAAPLDATTPAQEQPNRKQKKAPTGAKSRRTAKTAIGANSTKKNQGWQDYLREEFSDVPLSVAVSAVLQQQPDQALDITSVVNAVFVQQMPPDVSDKARDRVNNILSEGVRKNKWYRADAGSYSMSPVAT